MSVAGRDVVVAVRNVKPNLSLFKEWIESPELMFDFRICDILAAFFPRCKYQVPLCVRGSL